MGTDQNADSAASSSLLLPYATGQEWLPGIGHHLAALEFLDYIQMQASVDHGRGSGRRLHRDRRGDRSL